MPASASRREYTPLTYPEELLNVLNAGLRNQGAYLGLVYMLPVLCLVECTVRRQGTVLRGYRYQCQR